MRKLFGFVVPALIAVGAVALFTASSSSADRSTRPLVPPSQALTHTAFLPDIMGPLPPVVQCVNLATNGDFEGVAPGHPWTGVANQTTSVYVDTFISTVRAHGGAKSGRVGSSSLNSVWNEMIQTVQMPAGVISATLIYWRYLDTTETSLTTVYDRFSVGIETEQGIQIGTPQQIDNTSSGRGARNAWVQGTIDLPNPSVYSAQRLWLSFKAATDSNLPSSLYVDDVSFAGCATQ